MGNDPYRQVRCGRHTSGEQDPRRRRCKTMVKTMTKTKVKAKFKARVKAKVKVSNRNFFLINSIHFVG